jgi:muconolactone delta-isomerase
MTDIFKQVTISDDKKTLEEQLTNWEVAGWMFKAITGLSHHQKQYNEYIVLLRKLTGTAPNTDI